MQPPRPRPVLSYEAVEEKDETITLWSMLASMATLLYVLGLIIFAFGAATVAGVMFVHWLVK